MKKKKKMVDKLSAMLRLSSLLLLLIASDTYGYTDCSDPLCALLRAPASDYQKMNLILLTGSSATTGLITVPIGNCTDLVPKIDIKKAICMVLGGWGTDRTSNSVVTMAEAVQGTGNCNTIIIDWSIILKNLDYPWAAMSVDGVGWYIAQVLKTLVAALGILWSAIILIGHSLGAQACGFIGKYTGGQCGILWALDPAGPLFSNTILIRSVNASDAVSVRGLRTDKGGFGTEVDLGGIEFYFNGGRAMQPGCLTWEIERIPACSHIRAVTYFAEAITNNDMIGVQCGSYNSFKSGACANNPKCTISWNMPSDAQGDYYLQTASKTPFGKRDAGMVYS